MAGHSRLERLTLLSSDQDDQFADAVWRCLRRESDEAYARSPTLASLLADSIINQPNFETALFHGVASRLKNDIIPQSLIARAFRRAADASTEMVEEIRADLVAVVERDPACDRLIEPFLYLKGFHAIQAHRLAHWLWHNNEKDFAIYTPTP